MFFLNDKYKDSLKEYMIKMSKFRSDKITEFIIDDFDEMVRKEPDAAE